MLPEDELDDLAEDIKTNGLQHPIVVKDGELIDGRNRLAACESAGVEPSFEELDGQEPVAYILSANLARRHMTAGEKAITAARLQIAIEGRELARIVGVDPARISEATQILDHAPDQADQVLVGALPFSKALDEARTRKSDSEKAEAKLAKLRAEAPDLANQVADEILTLDEALAANKQRAEEAKARAKRISESLTMAINNLTKGFGTDELRQQAVEVYVVPGSAELTEGIDADDLRAAAEVCQDLAERWENHAEQEEA